MKYSASEQAHGLIAAAEILAVFPENAPVWVQIHSNTMLTLHIDHRLTTDDAEHWYGVLTEALVEHFGVAVEENDPASRRSYDVNYSVASTLEAVNGWKVSISMLRRATVTA
jgi:hypothetical protein